MSASLLAMITLFVLSACSKEDKVTPNTPAAETGHKLSRFMIEESQEPIQHVLAGIWSLPLEYLEYRLEDVNKEQFAVRVETDQGPQIIHVVLYQRKTTNPGAFPLIFQAKLALGLVGEKPNKIPWVEINFSGLVTGWGDEQGTVFEWEAPYSSESFDKGNKSQMTNERVREIYKLNSLQARKTLTSLRVYYYGVVVPPRNDAGVIHRCFSRTDKLIYEYARAPDGLIHMTEYFYDYQSSSVDPIMFPSRKYFDAPWRKK